jgi:hypothetical protein
MKNTTSPEQTLPASSQTSPSHDLLSLSRITGIPVEDIQALVEAKGIEAAEKLLLPAQPFNPPYLPETRYHLMTDTEGEDPDR